MAVNNADGTMFVCMPFCAISAGIGAARAGAGWLTPIFVVAGLVIGLCITVAGRWLIYAVLGRVVKRWANSSGWIQWVVGGPLLVLYIIVPYAFVWAGVYGTWATSSWIVRHGL